MCFSRKKQEIDDMQNKKKKLNFNQFSTQWSPDSLAKKCKFEISSTYFNIPLPTLYSPLFGISRSNYYPCTQFLFSGYISDDTNPIVREAYNEAYNSPKMSPTNPPPPFFRPSEIFTLFEVIDESKSNFDAQSFQTNNVPKTNIAQGKICLSDIICTADFENQFVSFFQTYQHYAVYPHPQKLSPFQSYSTRSQFFAMRVIFQECILRKKFIHFGNLPLIFPHNEHQYVLLHHPCEFQGNHILYNGYSDKMQKLLRPLSFRFSFTLSYIPRVTLSLVNKGFSFFTNSSLDPLLFDPNDVNVTSCHMTSPVLYLNCLSQSSLHTFYSFIMVMIQSRNYYSTKIKQDCDMHITVILQHPQFLDQETFITADLITSTIHEYLDMDVTIFLDGLHHPHLALSPPALKSRPSTSTDSSQSDLESDTESDTESEPTLISKFNPYHGLKEYVNNYETPRRKPGSAGFKIEPTSFPDGLNGVDKFSCSGITNDVIDNGKEFSRQFCMSFFTPIITQMFFSSNFSPQSNTSKRVTSSNLYILPFASRELLLPSTKYSPSVGYNLSPQIPPQISHPISLTSLYHTRYYHHCLDRQWQLFHPLGIQHFSLSMFALSFSKDGKRFDLYPGTQFRFEYFLSTKKIIPSSPSASLPNDNDNDNAHNNSNLPKQCNTLSPIDRFEHVTVPPSIAPLHSEYFNTSRVNSSALNPILSQIEPSTEQNHISNLIETELLSEKFPPRVQYVRCSSNQQEESISSEKKSNALIGTLENHPQFCQFKYAGNVADYHNHDYTAKINYFRGLTSSFLPPLPANDTLIKIISPDHKYPITQCRKFPLKYLHYTPNEVLYTLPMNQIIAMESYLQTSDSNEENNKDELIQRNKGPNALHPTIKTPTADSNSLVPLSNTVHTYYHIEMSNELIETENSKLFEKFFKQVFVYPFSCPGIMLLFQYSPRKPYIKHYTEHDYRFVEHLVQLPISIPLFFITILPNQFDITTSTIPHLTMKDVPYLGWDSTFSIDKLQRYIPQSPSSAPLAAMNAQKKSEQIIDLHKHLISQKQRHMEIFSTIVPQDMKEYLALQGKKTKKKNLSLETQTQQLLQSASQTQPSQQGECSGYENDIQITHLYKQSLSNVQFFVRQFEEAQLKQSKPTQRCMFHFAVSGIEGYNKALPFFNNVALAHYFLYRIHPKLS